MGIFDFLGGGNSKTAAREAELAKEQKEREREQVIAAQREAHEACEWPVPGRLNNFAVSGKEAVRLEDPLQAEDKDRVGALVYEPKLSPAQVKPLSDDELFFLLNACLVYNAAAPLENFEANRRVIYDEILDRLHNTENFYVLTDASTSYPMIDNGFVLVYRDEEHAKKAAQAYRAQMRACVVMKRPGEAYRDPENPDKKVLMLFDYFYYLGMERVLLDNGWYRVAISRSDISAPPMRFSEDASKVPPVSPELCFAMCDVVAERRWPVRYEKREEILKAKMQRVYSLMAKSTFMVPMVLVSKEDGKILDPAADPETGKLSVMVMQAPPVPAPGSADGQKTDAAPAPEQKKRVMVPVFTDVLEIAKGFPNIKNIRIQNLTFQQLMPLVAKTDGLIINPQGQQMVVALSGLPKGPAGAAAPAGEGKEEGAKS